MAQRGHPARRYDNLVESQPEDGELIDPVAKLEKMSKLSQPDPLKK